MRKIMSISVKGKEHSWAFMFVHDDKFLQEWRDDGLSIDEVINIIPKWIADMRLTRIFVWLQDRGVFIPDMNRIYK